MRIRAIASDRVFFVLVVTVVFAGLAIFSSATLGLLAREGSSISREILLQTGLGAGAGFIALALAALAPLASIRRASYYLFGATLIMTALVFVHGIGFSAGGATRWIDLGFTTFQPGEFLKIGFVLCFAAWLAPRARQLADIKKGLIPFSVFVALPSALLLAEPNTSTTFLILATGAAMYFAAGASWRDFGVIALAAVIVLGAIFILRPYTFHRLDTFIHPSADALGKGYQIQQSLIAIGSGGVSGRGFGQSVAKFNYLPEPDGDSIFAVYAEETGFIGASILLGLFVALAARGIVIAASARELYGGLVALGLSFLIITQAFINIAAMLGIIPLTGLPLPFVSHGGTALLAALLACGLILNVARGAKRA